MSHARARALLLVAVLLVRFVLVRSAALLCNVAAGLAARLGGRDDALQASLRRLLLATIERRRLQRHEGERGQLTLALHVAAGLGGLHTRTHQSTHERSGSAPACWPRPCPP